MDHDRGAKTGFVGEYAALKAHFHCSGNACANYAAGGGFQAERTLEDGNKHGGNGGDVHADNHQRAQEIQDDHKGHQLFGDIGNPLQTAQNHCTYGNQQENAGGDGGNAKGGMNVRNNGVHLAHVADAEGSQQTEERKQGSQYGADGFAALFGAKTVTEIIHCAAVPFALCVLSTEQNAQNVFGIIGHHAKEGNEPHPEHGTGTANCNGACYADDVTGANGGSQCGTQGLKLRNRAILGVTGDMLVLKNGADGVFHPVTNVA